ncbi:MAG: bifunctional metallophosphatase/5'-nucleotidase [Clostridiales bacterium]|nr:bifunctional metallophosphatase/5'-nucleotidase [Clostridiales bacterium]
MNKFLVLATYATMTLSATPAMMAEKIVIMHTNDTHSQIDPTPANQGGVARRKVLIDSIRAANANTLLVDAGDAVQGTTYFNLYGGEVEARMLNLLGYDYAILGNHEFDNGIEALANYISSINAPFISTNYEVEGTPLEGLLTRYTIIEKGGKKIGLIGLNVNPDGIIDPAKSTGLKYEDVYRAANSTAWHLKHNEGVDYVVALSHIGYDYENMPCDSQLAQLGHDIDLIIGGHSHTVITPGSPQGFKLNADREPVIITQTGNTGRYLGVVTLDTDTDSIQAELIPIDSRLDNRLDNEIARILRPYRNGVDSLKSIVIGKSDIDCLDRSCMPLYNFVSAFLDWRGKQLSPNGKIDLSFSNKGGVRTGMSRGEVTKGNVMEMLPFDNRVEVLDIKGSDLLEALAINSRMNRVSFDRPVVITMKGDRIISATIDGKKIDPSHTYRISTIDYIAKGGDYMEPLTRGHMKAQSDKVMNADVMEYIGALPGKTIGSDDTNYMTVKQVK